MYPPAAYNHPAIREENLLLQECLPILCIKFSWLKSSDQAMIMYLLTENERVTDLFPKLLSTFYSDLIFLFVLSIQYFLRTAGYNQKFESASTNKFLLRYL